MNNDKMKVTPRTKDKMEVTFQAFEKQFHVTFFSVKMMFSRTWDSYGTEFAFEFMPNDELYIYGNYDSMYVKGNDIYLRAYNKTFLLKDCFQYANFRCEFTGSITYRKIDNNWHINKKDDDKFNQKFEDWLRDDLNDMEPAKGKGDFLEY